LQSKLQTDTHSIVLHVISSASQRKLISIPEKNMRQIVLFLFTLIFSSPVLAKTTNAGGASPDTVVHNVMAEFMAHNNVPGVAVALYYQGQLHLYAFGVAKGSTGQAATSKGGFKSV
jgi:hypothetical protein